MISNKFFQIEKLFSVYRIYSNKRAYSNKRPSADFKIKSTFIYTIMIIKNLLNKRPSPPPVISGGILINAPSFIRINTV